MAQTFDPNISSSLLPAVLPPNQRGLGQPRNAPIDKGDDRFEKLQQQVLQEEDRFETGEKNTRNYAGPYTHLGRGNGERQFQSQLNYEAENNDQDPRFRGTSQNLSLFVAATYEDQQQRVFQPKNPGGNLDLVT